MPTAEQHNQLRAHALAVLIMDHLRLKATTGDTVTMWSLNATLCDRYQLHGKKRSAQYEVVRRVVMSLEAAGLIGSVKEWDKQGERYIKRIWPCSV